MREAFLRGRLLAAACAAALGGVAGKAGVSPLWFLVPASAVCLFALYARRRGWRAGWSLVCLLLLLSGLYAGHQRASSWRGRGGLVEAVCLTGEVEVGCRGGRDEAIELFAVEEVHEGGSARSGDRYLLRQMDEDGPQLRWGDRLSVKGTLFLFGKESGGVGGSLVAEDIEVLSHTSNPLLRLALAYRRVFTAQAQGLGDAPAAALVQGMVLGDYRQLGAGDLKAFRLTGLIHLCAASGLNLAILVAFIAWLGRRFRLPARAIMAVQAPVLICYALAVGLSVPVVRATVVALLAVAAFLLGRDFDLLPAMGAAVLYLVWEDPGAAAGVSFQLCFAASLGMALFHRPLRGTVGAGKTGVVEMLAATLAAQLAVGPILLCHFGEVSVLAPVSNLLVLPLVPAVMALAMLSALLGAAGLPLAGVLMQAAGLLARGILNVAHALASPAWAAICIHGFSPLWTAAYYPALATALLARGGWRRAGRAVLALLLAAVLCAGLLPHAGGLAADGGTRITFIDVGQGDATLLQMPSGATVLVDGGLEERVLASDLLARGVRRIDVVVISHPDADHIGGLEGALERCEVGMVVHPATKSSGQAGRLLAMAEEMGVEVHIMRAGDRLGLSDLQLTAYGPPQDIPDDVDTNEYSLVLRAEGAGFSLLLTGDVEEEGEGMLLRGGAELESDILKVPHHGGFCEVNDDFFARVDPEIAVISVGADNPYGHPSAATVASLERGGCAVYRTDESGDIVVHVAQGGYRVERERR